MATTMLTLLRRGALFALLWWVLTEGRHDSWPVGIIAVAATCWASVRLLPAGSPGMRITRLPGFVAFFVWHSLRGGAQVARLALQRRMALRPGMLELVLYLPAGAPRILMAATLGLMPGTLSVHLEDARLLVHVLDTRLPTAAEAAALQAHIACLFGATL